MSESIFIFDGLSKLTLALITFIFVIIFKFSQKYLFGDSQYKNFFINLTTATFFAAVTVISNNLVLFALSWILANFFLVRLMVHKNSWQAARNSGILALKNFAIGFAALVAAFSLIYLQTQHLSISHALAYLDYESKSSLAIALLLIIAAMTQSAIWPFNKWLNSSLNSPTPVSAFMHAGLINGGGIMLIKFHSIFFNQPQTLNLILIFGAVTAILASFWKLVQSDIKKMLACSTVAQMGFMFVQCGLGLFSAAAVHAVWHGLFKAYLFLCSPDAAKNQNKNNLTSPSLNKLFLAIAFGLLALLGFAIASKHNIYPINSRFVLLVIVWISGSQLALSLMHCQHQLCHASKSNFLQTPVILFFFGFVYGALISLVEARFNIGEFSIAQPLNFIHFIIMAIFIMSWLVVLYRDKLQQKFPQIYAKIYVKFLNNSQPNANTVTAVRKLYDYSK